MEQFEWGAPDPSFSHRPDRRHDDPLGTRRPAVVRRSLRDSLLESGVSAADAPHSFDVDRLLAFAETRSRAADAPVELVDETARALTAHGRYDEAIEVIDRLRSTKPEKHVTSRCLYRLGEVERRRRDFPLAQKLYEQALAASERNRRLRGEILLSAGTVELHLKSAFGAERQFRSVVELNLKEIAPLGRLGIARALRDRREWEAAAREIDRARAEFEELGSWRGVRAAVTGTAAWAIDAARWSTARAALDRIRETDRHVLDACHLALLHSLYAEADARQERLDEAIRHAEQSIRWTDREYDQAFPDRLIQLLQLLARRGRTADALSVAGLALSETNGSGDAVRRFDVVAALFDAIGPTVPADDRLAGDGPDTVDLIELGRTLIEAHGARLDRDSLLRFANAVNQRALDSRPSTPTNASDYAATRLRPYVLEARLQEELGDGLPGRSAPPAGDLTAFLVQFAGSTLRSAQYTSEFSFTQERAKRHLRALCTAGVLRRRGDRKASRYTLAFWFDEPTD